MIQAYRRFSRRYHNIQNARGLKPHFKQYEQIWLLSGHLVLNIQLLKV